jgi:hypothetical protein
VVDLLTAEAMLFTFESTHLAAIIIFSLYWGILSVWLFLLNYWATIANVQDPIIRKQAELKEAGTVL